MKAHDRDFRELIKVSEIQEGLLFFLCAALLLVYSLVNHLGSISLEWKLSPYLFPLLIAICLGVLSVSLLAEGFRKKGTEEVGAKKGVSLWKRSICIFLFAICYFLLMNLITFIPATILFLIVSFLYLGERRLWLIGALSLSTAFIVYFLFDVMLHVMLP
jgi:hypothetical protein